jgi:NADH-quinone oxidoreductase subunit E
MTDNFKINKTSHEYKTFLKEFSKIKNNTTPLIEALHVAQNCFACVPQQIQQFIADELDVPMSQVYGVVTFYSKFTLKPKAKNVIYVCTGTACYVKEANQILDRFQDILKIKKGAATKDGNFFIDTSRCVGCCGNAPVVVINEKTYGNVKLDSLQAMLDEYK